MYGGGRTSGRAGRAGLCWEKELQRQKQRKKKAAESINAVTIIWRQKDGGCRLLFCAMGEMTKNIENANDSFFEYTYDILENNAFLELKNLSHHGLNRYEHSLRVAKISYKVASFLK